MEGSGHVRELVVLSRSTADNDWIVADRAVRSCLTGNHRKFGECSRSRVAVDEAVIAEYELRVLLTVRAGSVESLHRQRSCRNDERSVDEVDIIAGYRASGRNDSIVAYRRSLGSLTGQHWLTGRCVAVDLIGKLRVLLAILADLVACLDRCSVLDDIVELCSVGSLTNELAPLRSFLVSLLTACRYVEFTVFDR